MQVGVLLEMVCQNSHKRCIILAFILAGIQLCNQGPLNVFNGHPAVKRDRDVDLLNDRCEVLRQLVRSFVPEGKAANQGDQKNHPDGLFGPEGILFCRFQLVLGIGFQLL